MSLKQFAQDEIDRIEPLRDQAQQALADAQAAVNAARTQKETRTAETAAQLRTISDLRRAIAEAPMPADMAQLVSDLRAELLELRKRRSAFLDAEEALAAAEAELERARTESDGLAAALAAARGMLQRETERQDRQVRWAELLLEEPLVSVPARAGQLQASSLFTEAKARVEEIPQELRAIAVARLDRELARQAGERREIEGAENILAGVVATEQGNAGEASREWTKLLRAEARLGAWVEGAKARLDQAAGLLEKVRSGPRLTDEEKAHLADIEAAEAAEKGKDVEDAHKVLEAAILARENKRLELRAANVDAAPAAIEADPAFVTLQEAVTDAQEDLTDKEALFTAQMQTDLEAWEAAVPDGVWDGLAAFEKARRILVELSPGPGNLGTVLVDAEDALVAALQEESKSARTLDFLRGRAESLRRRLRQTENLREPQIARAVRGDA